MLIIQLVNETCSTSRQIANKFRFKSLEFDEYIYIARAKSPSLMTLREITVSFQIEKSLPPIGKKMLSTIQVYIQSFKSQNRRRNCSTSKVYRTRRGPAAALLFSLHSWAWTEERQSFPRKHPVSSRYFWDSGTGGQLSTEKMRSIDSLVCL